MPQWPESRECRPGFTCGRTDFRERAQAPAGSSPTYGVTAATFKTATLERLRQNIMTKLNLEIGNTEGDH